MINTPHSFRTPFKKIQGIGAARGSTFWILQRISAVCFLIFFVWVLRAFLNSCLDSYDSFISWVHIPWNRASLLLLLIAMTLHMVSGLQIIAEDYLPKAKHKLLAIFCIRFSSLIFSSVALVVLLSL